MYAIAAYVLLQYDLTAFETLNLLTYLLALPCYTVIIISVIIY